MKGGNDNDEAGVAVWRVDGAALPQLHLRLLGLLAQRELTPCAVDIRCGGGRLSLNAQMRGIDRRQAAIVAAKMQEVPGVQSALLDWKALL